MNRRCGCPSFLSRGTHSSVMDKLKTPNHKSMDHPAQRLTLLAVVTGSRRLLHRLVGPRCHWGWLVLPLPLLRSCWLLHPVPEPDEARMLDKPGLRLE